MREDPRPITPEMRAQARALNRKLAAVETRLLLAYFKPGFHPWKVRDERYLAEWYASAGAA